MMKAVKREIKITRTESSRLPEVDPDDVPFGRVFSDHMLVADYRDGTWQEAEIRPYDRITMYPCITALQYGLSIFEGMKAHKTVHGEPVLFRPRDNYLRFNRSAARLVMPALPEEIFVNGLKELVRLDAGWIPRKDGSALYIRPFMFATDEYIGIKPSDTYKFIIITCPVGPYYLEPVNLWITKEYVRAFEGGT
ncbi:MAG: branched chain amino acid aminotransferase, partial [Acidobacteriota bacterium]